MSECERECVMATLGSLTVYVLFSVCIHLFGECILLQCVYVRVCVCIHFFACVCLSHCGSAGQWLSV